MVAMGRSFTAFENDERDSINPVFINAGNPASLASLRLTSFEAGGKSYFNFLQSATEKSYKNNTYLSYISLGFPLGKRTGICAGITPFSNVGYKIIDSNSVDGIGAVKTLYEGNGGLSQVFLGFGIKPFQGQYSRFLRSRLHDSLRRAGRWDEIRKKKFFKSALSSLAVGANAYIMFGDLDNTTSVIYPSSATYFNTRRIRNTRVSDYYFSYGAMISFRVDSTYKRRHCRELNDKGESIVVIRKECLCKDSLSREEYEKQFPKRRTRRSDMKITLGATAYIPTNLNADYTALGYTYKTFSSTIDIPYDTTLNVQRSGNLTMPLIMSFGAGLKKGTRLTLLADVSMQNWSYYRFFGEDPKLKNSMRYSLGFQYVNNGEIKFSRDLYREKAMYRGGIYYSTGYLDLKNTPMQEYGVSVGVGIPMGRNIFNHANISAEVGTWGTTKNNLIKNNFIRCTLGLTLNQKWFVKRVID